jgi:G:T-mismatch repair DNA endonuclease (very short patch repair protein)
MRKFWTNDEKELLRKLYEDDGLSLSELYPIFSEQYDRTSDSVEVKISRFKLRHKKEQIRDLKSRLNKGGKNGMYGKEGPNRGLNKDNCERIKIAAEKISNTRKEMYENGELEKLIGDKNPMYGETPWNKGESKYTKESIRIGAEKVSLSRKIYWKNLSEEKQSEIIGNLSLYANMAKKDTKIEIIIKNSLEKLKINFIKNHRVSRYIFDFYLPDHNCIIECQGDYWHANPEIYIKENYTEAQKENVERDKRKIKYINDNKYKSIYLWENYIHKNKNVMCEILLEKLI